jgi:N-acetylmuramoyl-L-alanine amidase
VRGLLALVAAGAALAVAALPPAPAVAPAATDGAGASLTGVVIVLDPGHQLGNRLHPREIGRPVDAGGFTKACNTTGSSTDAGYPESTFNWEVALVLRDRLAELGARVVLTRTSDSDAAWGPCVDERGRVGNDLPADLRLSIHGDGCVGCGPGFHVIAPASRDGWTDDIAAPSLDFARALQSSLREAGMPPAGYVGGGDGLVVRSDLGTLNWSDVPAAMVELGNLRDPVDAGRMTSRAGQEAYADALLAAVLAHLSR